MNLINIRDNEIKQIVQSADKVANMVKRLQLLLTGVSQDMQRWLRVKNLFVRFLAICFELNCCEAFGIFFACYYAQLARFNLQNRFETNFERQDWQTIFATAHKHDNLMDFLAKISPGNIKIGLDVNYVISFLPADRLDCLEYLLNIMPFHELVKLTGSSLFDSCFLVFGDRVYDVNIRDCDWDNMIIYSKRKYIKNDARISRFVTMNHERAKRKLKFNLCYQAAHQFVQHHDATTINSYRELIPDNCHELLSEIYQRIHYPTFTIDD